MAQKTSNNMNCHIKYTKANKHRGEGRDIEIREQERGRERGREKRGKRTQ